MLVVRVGILRLVRLLQRMAEAEAVQVLERLGLLLAVLAEVSVRKAQMRPLQVLMVVEAGALAVRLRASAP